MSQKVQEDTPSIKRIQAEINRKFGAGTMGILSEMKDMSVVRLPVGIEALDRTLGGGWPLGRIVELYGIPSSGKSLICLKTVAAAQKAGLDTVYIDAEQAFDPAFALSLGVDVTKLSVVQTSIGEDVFEILFKILEAEPGVVVIDSVASLIPKAEMEEPLEQQFMALKARMMSRVLPKLNQLNKKTLLLFINQLRNTLTMYGNPVTTPGGQALKFFASIRMEVKQPSEKIRRDGKKTTDIIGQIVQFRTVKNKTFTPFQQGQFDFYYEDCRIL